MPPHTLRISIVRRPNPMRRRGTPTNTICNRSHVAYRHPNPQTRPQHNKHKRAKHNPMPTPKPHDHPPSKALVQRTLLTAMNVSRRESIARIEVVVGWAGRELRSPGRFLIFSKKPGWRTSIEVLKKRISRKPHGWGFRAVARGSGARARPTQPPPRPSIETGRRAKEKSPRLGRGLFHVRGF